MAVIQFKWRALNKLFLVNARLRFLAILVTFFICVYYLYQFTSSSSSRPPEQVEFKKSINPRVTINPQLLLDIYAEPVYNQDDPVYDVTFPPVDLVKMTDTVIIDINELQEHLSHVLFWSHEPLSTQSEHLSKVSNIVQMNYAILQLLTFKHQKPPLWETYTDFMLTSTAFTQNYYLETYKSSFSESVQRLSKTEKNPEILKYEALLFPWLKKSIRMLQKSFTGRGIVITSSNKQFKSALLLIRTLREVLGCMLPIEFFFLNHNDLSVRNRKLLMRFNDLKVVDLSMLVDTSQAVGADGWWGKVFSILMSSFEEVIFIDADALFMVNPEVLFSYPKYLKYGQLLFRDRKFSFEWFKDAFPFASETLWATAMWNETSKHEAESGVLVYNKKNPSSFFGLLNTCNLNRRPMRTHVEWIFWGDKETHWMGFELLTLPYAFDKMYGGALGYSSSPGSICGSLSHVDDKGKLIWFNGGIAVDKGMNGDEILEFEYHATDDGGELGEWEWSDDLMRSCFRPANPIMVKPLNSDEKTLLKKYVEMYSELSDDYKKIQ